MENKINELKTFLRDDAIRSAYEMGQIVGSINKLSIFFWKQFTEISPAKKQISFKEQLKGIIEKKIKEIPSLCMIKKDIDRLNNELYKLLKCSIASNRTPDEIVSALKTDKQMRKEVVDLIVSRVKPKPPLGNQRLLVENILSDGKDLNELLNNQVNKKGFPFDI